MRKTATPKSTNKTSTDGTPVIGWTQIYHPLVDTYGSRITPHGLAVYLVIARHADAAGVSFPSVATIAKKAGVSKATVNRILPKLSELGLISIRKRALPKGNYTSNEYRLLNPWMGSITQTPPSLAEIPPVVADGDGGSITEIHKVEPIKLTQIKEDTGEEGESTGARHSLSPDDIGDWNGLLEIAPLCHDVLLLIGGREKHLVQFPISKREIGKIHAAEDALNELLYSFVGRLNSITNGYFYKQQTQPPYSLDSQVISDFVQCRLLQDPAAYEPKKLFPAIVRHANNARQYDVPKWDTGEGGVMSTVYETIDRFISYYCVPGGRDGIPD